MLGYITVSFVQTLAHSEGVGRKSQCVWSPPTIRDNILNANSIEKLEESEEGSKG